MTQPGRTEDVGFCGYDCGHCAARSDDRAERQKLVDGWKRLFGHQKYTADNVRCDGCRAGARLADTECMVRPCAVERKVESCADCPDFPCDKVRPLMGSRDGLLIYCCRDKAVTEEEYNRCCRQFESMPNLVARLAERGRLDRTFKKGD
jgi:hypothetical protein